ncbi:MAG: hypothetical protein K2G70_07315 [Turicibacter sp.]|nr:hypothetical protein [Turicibacter sp.]
MSIKDEFVRWARRNLSVPDLEVSIGFQHDATYNSNNSNAKEVKYVAQVAYDNNYGNGVPARPFFTNVVDGDKDYQRIFEEYIKEGYPVAQALTFIGIEMQQDVQQEIITLREPPNSPATIARKKSSNPLVDTGHMGDSVTYVIKGAR